MCGICGKFSPAGIQIEEINTMLNAIAHRGPDDEGVFIAGSVGLGNRRLSIIDLPGGKQPICNETGNIWITFNGEIYNYRQLRQQLESKGHVFRTNSDTEVIVHLYEDLGEGCVELLNGMFAFAVWDAAVQKLFLARDRIGQKPLYYSFEEGEFTFASEVKALLAISRQKPEMDLLAIHDYLSLRFIPSPRTIFRHINKLPPAHTLVFQGGAINIRRYWGLSFQEKLDLSETELLELLVEQLAQTVGSHLISDVPVGAFLSGGLDSSMIVAILCRDLGHVPQTFSIGVEETDFDELSFARRVAEHYSTRHFDARISADLIHSLPKIIWHMDEPSDPIAACMFQAAKLASQHVKVVLGGDGGDELFAGFDRYMGNQVVNAYSYLPDLFRSRLIGPLLERIPDSFTYKSTTQKLRWVHQLSLKPDSAGQYAEATLFFRFNHRQKQELYTPQLWRQLGDIDSSRVITTPFDSQNGNDLLDRMLYSDFVTRLPEHSLMLTDRMTMAHGLEARSPYLDHRLVELLAKFPAKFKIRNRQSKYLLRKLAADYLPKVIVHRKKHGFMFPIAYWLRTELHPFAEQVLTNSFYVREGLFSKEMICRLLDEHRSQRVDHHVRLWMLLNLEIWQQLFIEQALPETVNERLATALSILD